MSDKIRAVGLLSGGLDSTLAVRIMLDQGIEVTALHFRTGFSYVERNRLVGRQPAGPTDAERMAALLKVPLETIDVSDEFLPVVLNPRYGYGSGMNPCVDCRIFLLQRAKAWMEEHNYHFVFTGEVVGQRPKSQMRQTLATVERRSGLTGYLLRPLSAKLLPPTVPELRGWVDRERLYAIGGRGRREQIALAESFGITGYAQPSGGCCYLIDRNYSRRLKDFINHPSEGREALTGELVQLLAVGRHLRLPSGRRVVIGRDEGENEYLRHCSIQGVRLTTLDYPGPTALVEGEPEWDEIELAARITAGYSDGKNEPAVLVEVRYGDGSAELTEATPLPMDESRALMI